MVRPSNKGTAARRQRCNRPRRHSCLQTHACTAASFLSSVIATPATQRRRHQRWKTLVSSLLKGEPNSWRTITSAAIPEKEATFHEDADALHARQAPLYALCNENLFHSIPGCTPDDLQIFFSLGSLRRQLLNLPFPGLLPNTINIPSRGSASAHQQILFQGWKLIHCWYDRG